MINPGSILERGVKKLAAPAFSLLLREGPPPDPSRPPSFLLLRPDRLGDFILASPALLALQKNIPKGSQVTLVVGERAREIALVFFPDFKILVFPKNRWARIPVYARLWRGRFDVVVDLHSYPFSTTSALLAALPRSGRRVGFTDPSYPLSSKIFNQPVSLKSGETHEKEKNLMLVGKLLGKKRLVFDGLPALRLPEDVEKSVEDFYREAGIQKKDFVVGIHPTLLKEDNRWSQDNYLRFVRALKKKGPAKIVVVWGKGEEGTQAEFQEKIRGVSGVHFLPASDLLFLLGAARRFSGFVCNDSGLMHAASLVTRIFAIFGPSHPGQWKPIGKKGIKIFRAHDGKCDSVSPEAVAAEIRK